MVKKILTLTLWVKYGLKMLVKKEQTEGLKWHENIKNTTHCIESFQYFHIIIKDFLMNPN
jgi:hypothetical protein